jgi:hypothetical protein
MKAALLTVVMLLTFGYVEAQSGCFEAWRYPPYHPCATGNQAPSYGPNPAPPQQSGSYFVVHSRQYMHQDHYVANLWMIASYACPAAFGAAARAIEIRYPGSAPVVGAIRVAGGVTCPLVASRAKGGWERRYYVKECGVQPVSPRPTRVYCQPWRRYK